LRHRSENPDSTVLLGQVLSDVREIEVKRDEYPLFLLANVEDSAVGLAAEALLQHGFDIVAAVREQCCCVARQVLIKLEPRRPGGKLRRDRNDSLPRELGRICQRRRNVLRLERWVLFQDPFNRLVRRKVVEDDRHRDSCAAEAHSSVQYLRINGDVGRPVHLAVSVWGKKYSTGRSWRITSL
jgi:hypothetical protein